MENNLDLFCGRQPRFSPLLFLEPHPNLQPTFHPPYYQAFSPTCYSTNNTTFHPTSPTQPQMNYTICHPTWSNLPPLDLTWPLLISLNQSWPYVIPSNQTCTLLTPFNLSFNPLDSKLTLQNNLKRKIIRMYFRTEWHCHFLILGIEKHHWRHVSHKLYLKCRF